MGSFPLRRTQACRLAPRRLKKLVAGAERDKAELAALRDAGAHDAADARQWDEALRTASGARPAVDAAKVKKALKAREKKKEKSKKEWAKRDRAKARHFAAKTVPSGRRAPKDGED